MKRTPLRRRPVRKRVDRQPMCIDRNCRRARLEGSNFCIIHETYHLWSGAVLRRDHTLCQAPPANKGACAGRLEADHLISRSYGATRWNVEVGITLCLAHHKWYTEHPLEHVELAKGRIGAARYDELRKLAMTHVAEDPEEALERLRKSA